MGVKGVGKNTYALTEFEGLGYKLSFQDGPIAEFGQNGTTNEQILGILVERLQSLNVPPFNCRENSLAITHLEEALHWLWARTKNRQERGVEGTSTP